MTVTANVVAAQHIFYTGGLHHVSVTASTRGQRHRIAGCANGFGSYRRGGHGAGMMVGFGTSLVSLGWVAGLPVMARATVPPALGSAR